MGDHSAPNAMSVSPKQCGRRRGWGGGLVGCCSHLPGTHILSLSPPCYISKLFIEFILKVPLGRLVKEKLYCMIDIVHSDLFTQHGKISPCSLFLGHSMCVSEVW